MGVGPRERLDGYLADLQAAHGSDLHLRVGGPARIRVNGVLSPTADATPLDEADTQAIAAEIIRPQLAERFRRGEEVDFAYSPAGRPTERYRVNAYLQRDTVALVLRTVVTEPKSVDDLFLPDVVGRMADEPRGLVLVAGPTGSGKTTTLAAMVDHINRTRSAHIVTIEDPIEVIHTDAKASISQRELGADTPSFASAIRASLRQDPDVILVGEMRDAATVAAALQAAETGHLVLSTLHTTDAAETISRIVELFPAGEQAHVRLVLSGVLRGVVCQRLVATLDGSARRPVTETVVVNGRVQSWIRDPDQREQIEAIIADGEFYGMHTFDQSILALYADGLIDLKSALGVATNPHDLTVEIRRRGLDDGRVTPKQRQAADALAVLVDQLAVDAPTPEPVLVPSEPPPPAPAPAKKPESVLARVLRRLF
ncbi:MAG: twitching motility protein PilT [Actinomycetota bacterium]|jgi:twitching motility protein PilT|nr:twitching motility protein PilT [Actinomycetota bacterium]